MKWGRRNGPPYPLKDGAHSAAEQKANPSLARRAANAAKSVVNKANALVKGNGHYHYGKNPRRLSDEELSARIKRLKQEAEYEQLLGKKTRAQRLEIKMTRGKKFAEQLGLAVGANLGRRIGNFGQGVGDIARGMAKTVADDVASVPGILVKGVAKDVATIPGALFRGGKNTMTAAGQAISNHQRKKEDYETKLAAAKSKKAYEDWKLANDPEYRRSLIKKGEDDILREERKQMQAENRRMQKDMKNERRALERERKQAAKKEDREYRDMIRRVSDEWREEHSESIDNGRRFVGGMSDSWANAYFNMM